MVEDEPSHWTMGWSKSAAGDARQWSVGYDDDYLQDWDIDNVSIDSPDFALLGWWWKACLIFSASRNDLTFLR